MEASQGSETPDRYHGADLLPGPRQSGWCRPKLAPALRSFAAGCSCRSRTGRRCRRIALHQHSVTYSRVPPDGCRNANGTAYERRGRRSTQMMSFVGFRLLDDGRLVEAVHTINEVICKIIIDVQFLVDEAD